MKKNFSKSIKKVLFGLALLVCFCSVALTNLHASTSYTRSTISTELPSNFVQSVDYFKATDSNYQAFLYYLLDDVNPDNAIVFVDNEYTNPQRHEIPDEVWSILDVIYVNPAFDFNNEWILYYVDGARQLRAYDIENYRTHYFSEYNPSVAEFNLVLPCIGYTMGYLSGNDSDMSYQLGLIAGKEEGLAQGQRAAYNEGYSHGYADAAALDSNNTLVGMMNTILSYPVRLWKEAANFNFLGVNIAGFMLSALTLLITIVIVKRIL